MQIDINLIFENPQNPRKITEEMFEKLKNSIKEDPQILDAKPLVVERIDGNYIVLGGNMRLKALKALNYREVPIFDATNWSKETKRRFIVKDNLSNGIWDYELLASQYDMDELENWGMEDIDKYYEQTPDEKENDIPETPETAQTVLGDVYELGKHRIVCGDSTSEEDIKLLFGVKKAKLIFTSPPYNMSGGMYENYDGNLAREEYIDFNLNVIGRWQDHLMGFIFWNISYNKNARDEFIEILYRIIKETGLRFLELIVWNKKTAMPIISKEALTRQYEDILVVGNDESIKEDLEMGAVLRNSKTAFFNTRTKKYLRNYWEISPLGSQLDNHKACFPVELPEKALNIMTTKDEIVADPFLGSGTTLIACEKNDRICYGIELSPNYVDVCIQRWVDYTGVEEVKKNGQSITWKTTQKTKE
jgi:DNA modification methylase